MSPWLIWSLEIPLKRIPQLSPADAVSSVFLNISIPVTSVSNVPLINTCSPTDIEPDATLPVTTVPLPVIVKTSSTVNEKSPLVVLTFTLLVVGTVSTTNSSYNFPLLKKSNNPIISP